MLLLLLIALSGCSSASPAPQIQTVPKPTPIKTVPVKFTIVDGLFALDPRNYENMALNLADILRWVEEANSQLDHYRRQHDGEEAQ